MQPALGKYLNLFLSSHCPIHVVEGWPCCLRARRWAPVQGLREAQEKARASHLR